MKWGQITGRMVIDSHKIPGLLWFSRLSHSQLGSQDGTGMTETTMRLCPWQHRFQMPAARRVNGTNCCPAGVATGELPRGSNEELLTCAVSPKCIQICYENGLIMHFANVFLQSLDDVQIAHRKGVPCSTVCNCGQALRTDTAPKLLPSLPANVFFVCLSGVTKHLIITHDRSKHDSTIPCQAETLVPIREHTCDASVYAASVQQHAWLTGRNIPIYYIYIYIYYTYILNIYSLLIFVPFSIVQLWIPKSPESYPIPQLRPRPPSPCGGAAAQRHGPSPGAFAPHHPCRSRATPPPGAVVPLAPPAGPTGRSRRGLRGQWPKLTRMGWSNLQGIANQDGLSEVDASWWLESGMMIPGCLGWDGEWSLAVHLKFSTNALTFHQIMRTSNWLEDRSSQIECVP